MKYNAENVNEIVFLKYLIFIVAGGFSTYLTTHLLPINNDDFNINYKILKTTAVSMLVGYVIGAFFLFISSTIINIVEKKYGDSRVPVPVPVPDRTDIDIEMVSNPEPDTVPVPVTDHVFVRSLSYTEAMDEAARARSAIYIVQQCNNA